MATTTRSLPPSSQERQDQSNQLVANQEPRFRIEPQNVFQTDGPAAASMCEHYWFTLDPWQRILLNCWLGRDENGRLTCSQAGVSGPRQNGKNGAIEAFELYLLVTQPGIEILHTAHRNETAYGAFERMRTLFEGNVPGKGREARTLMKLVDKANGGGIRLANGEWSIRLSNGSRIRYRTRSNGTGRGITGINVLILDEAQELTDTIAAALVSTTSAAIGDSIIISLGTPPDETAPGEVFTRDRNAALHEPGPQDAWHEWSIETLPPEDATFEDVIPLIYETNPAYMLDRPASLEENRTRREWVKLGFEKFCRERLGYWQSSEVSNPAFEMAAWEKLIEEHPATAQGMRQTVGIKFSPDNEFVAVVQARKVGKDKPHIELVECTNIGHMSTKPLAESLYKLRNKLNYILIDGTGRADSLMDDLKTLKYPAARYGRATTRDVVNASSSMIGWVRSGAFTHYGQEALDDSVKKATKRKIGSSGGFGFGGVSPEPIEAASLALLAMKRAPRTKPTKTRKRVRVRR